MKIFNDLKNWFKDLNNAEYNYWKTFFEQAKQCPDNKAVLDKLKECRKKIKDMYDTDATARRVKRARREIFKLGGMYLGLLGCYFGCQVRGGRFSFVYPTEDCRKFDPNKTPHVQNLTDYLTDGSVDEGYEEGHVKAEQACKKALKAIQDQANRVEKLLQKFNGNITAKSDQWDKLWSEGLVKLTDTSVVSARVDYEHDALSQALDSLRKLNSSSSHHSDVLFDELNKLKIALRGGNIDTVNQAFQSLAKEYSRFGGSAKVSQLIKSECGNFITHFKEINAQSN